MCAYLGTWQPKITDSAKALVEQQPDLPTQWQACHTSLEMARFSKPHLYLLDSLCLSSVPRYWSVLVCEEVMCAEGAVIDRGRIASGVDGVGE